MPVKTYKKALVTGGSRGIGFEIAKALTAQGTKVVIAARDPDELARAARSLPGVVDMQVDLTDVGSRSLWLERFLKEHADVDLVINNAGTMLQSHPFRPDAWERARFETALMLAAPMEIAYATLPLLKTNGGTIVNVTSGLIYAPVAAAPAYSAVKAGLHAFTRAFRAAVEPLGVTVAELIPPTVNTELSKAFNREVGAKGQNGVTAEKVAAVLLEGLRKGRSEIKVGQANALSFIARVTPSGAMSMLNSATAAKA
jgi:uncharacterized oxidoreductase